MTSQAALIFANGDLNDGPAVRAVLARWPDAYVIAADGGARNALSCNLIPHLIIGDFDSLMPAELRMFEAQGAEVRRFPAHKNETDLELALLTAVEQERSPIRVLGGVGDRLDQTFANVYLLALPALRDCDVRLVAGKQTAWLAWPGVALIAGQPGDTLSLIPLSGAAEGISTEGLEYALQGETLHFGPARGISNVLTREEAEVRFEAGLLLLIHTVGHA